MGLRQGQLNLLLTQEFEFSIFLLKESKFLSPHHHLRASKVLSGRFEATAHGPEGLFRRFGRKEGAW